MKRIIAWVLCAVMLTAVGCAAAERAPEGSVIAYEGSVVGGVTEPITAGYGGKLINMTRRAGDLVKEGEVLGEITTTRVYAPVEGTVSGLYVEEGDKAEDVTERYGASLYIEPTNRYLIAATTDKAYSSSEAHYVHLGERVYLRCTVDGSHQGIGRVTVLTEKGYNIEVTGGDLFMGEKMDIFRQSDFARESCIGRGTVDRAKPVAVKGTGSVQKIHVQNGDFVERGELLFETVDGTLDGLYAPGTEVLAPMTGIVSSVVKNSGETVSKGDTLLKVIPSDSLQVAFEVPEADLFSLREGQKVRMELYWDNDNGKMYSGELLSISHINSAAAASSGESGTSAAASSSTERKNYTAYASINADERIRVGMSVTVYVESAD